MREELKRAERVIAVAHLGNIAVRKATFGSSIRNPADLGAPPALEVSYEGFMGERDGPSFRTLTLLSVQVFESSDPDSTEPEDTDADVSKTTAEVKPGAEPEVEDGQEAVMWVNACYEISYRLPPDFEVVDEELEAFAATNGVFNSWPYFREFVHSCSSRMSLPPILLPLFRVPRDSDDDDEDSPSVPQGQDKSES